MAKRFEETAMLSDEEKERYRRQLIMPEFGEREQESLKAAAVCIAGAGGLGSPAAAYLAAAGVGVILLCDSGTVELSNLNRQFLYGADSLGSGKTAAAKQFLKRFNPSVRVVEAPEPITSENAPGLVGKADLVLDCLDNFETRYILNESCAALGVPFIHAGVHAMAGQITFIHPPETPCLRCVFPEARPSSRPIPVLGAATGVIGTLQALEAVKYLAGMGSALKNRLLIFDGEDLRFDEVAIARDPACPVCGGLYR